ncbi:MAG: Arc family DNA-binding protein [Oscillospiraceae bacterium]|nr:Arc family DNA-binding protein [Oscillospiraceae bacterium]
MNGPKKTVGIRIPAKSLEKLRLIAKQDSRSVSSMIRVLIYNCVEEFEKEHGTIDPP